MPTGVTKGAPIADKVAPPKGSLSDAGHAAIHNAPSDNESIIPLFVQWSWLSRDMNEQDSEDPALERLRLDTKIGNRPRVKEMPQALAERNTGKTKRDHHPVKSSRVTKSMAELKTKKEKQQDKETRLGPEKTRIAKEAARKRKLDEDEAMANAYQKKLRYLV
ncbi:MAG: hypothetical protein L6R42_006315 [Xanthoria sp. 1 TBL-2021]|nr:MAG: hypothetical protein L6R42_006315 [Xanthoria sp. 1 TBL-2021]